MKLRISVEISGYHLIMYIGCLTIQIFHRKKTLCVYINHVLDVKAFVVRSLSDGQSKPTSLFFALNVGKDSSGSVFIASRSLDNVPC